MNSIPYLATRNRETRVFENGELVYDVNESILYLGNGITPGGIPVGKTQLIERQLDGKYSMYCADIEIPFPSNLSDIDKLEELI